MNYSFNLEILSVFDLELKEFSLESLKNSLSNTIYSDFDYNYKNLDDSIYDIDFKKNNLKTVISLNSEIFISEINNEFSKIIESPIGVELCFDKSQIGSLKFSFKIEGSYEINTLILRFQNLIELVEKQLLEFFLNELKNNTKLRLFSVLSERMIYSVIYSNDSLQFSDKEIFGISWMYSDYEKTDSDLMNKILHNIKIQKDDIFAITPVATFISIVAKDQYFNNRVSVIETFLKQKFLLKKIDFQISNLFESLDYCDDPKESLKKIKDNQVKFNSNLEFYRNMDISVVDSISLLFETLKNVFGLHKHYKNVQEKLRTCNDLYQSLFYEEQIKNDEERKIKLEEYEKERKRQIWILQVAVFIVGITTLIVAIVAFLNVLCDDVNGFKDIQIAFIFVTGFILISSSIYLIYKSEGSRDE